MNDLPEKLLTNKTISSSRHSL